ncbi:uncharacterized protein RAG0_02755 [Rhynchosporium agropyri]|uniref:Uncharacterized protein n=1 Tax=Rhynchosporium agropyri TaxID=914238 RepID=A0A1E1K2Y3_9HELO|nr:uncharacterized protein RAG0_02755 [Rhynchosporium agropyri]
MEEDFFLIEDPSARAVPISEPPNDQNHFATPVVVLDSLARPCAQSPQPEDTVSILLNEAPFTANTHARIQILSEDNMPVEAAADTASPIGLIDEPSLALYFPSAQPQRRKDGLRVSLSGVGSSPTISNYVEISVSCRTISGKTLLQFPAYRCYIVPKIPGGILLGLDFFSDNKLDFRWGSSGKPHRLQVADSNNFILLKTTKTVRANDTPKRTNIYLLQTVVVHPGEGINLPATHRLLPERQAGYIVCPYPQIDMSLGKFGSVVNAVTTGLPAPIPFADLGFSPIRLRRGMILGVLEECAPKIKDCPVLLNLSSIYEGQPFVEEEPEGRHPAGTPFLIRPLPEDTAEPDISDAFGADIKDKIQEVLRRHANLFRHELGRFNDGN